MSTDYLYLNFEDKLYIEFDVFSFSGPNRTSELK